MTAITVPTRLHKISHVTVLAGMAIAVAMLVASCQLHTIGAGALLFPSRQVTQASAPPGCIEKTFTGDGVNLVGWQCASRIQPRKGAVVYLHGIADNRSSAAGIARLATSG